VQPLEPRPKKLELVSTRERVASRATRPAESRVRSSEARVVGSIEEAALVIDWT
jgi:hypothetical protein